MECNVELLNSMKRFMMMRGLFDTMNMSDRLSLIQLSIIRLFPRYV